MLKKIIKSLLFLAIFIFTFVASVGAAELLVVKSIDMPDYVNWLPFDISYTAIQANGSPVEVKGYIKKEGGDWKEVGASTKFADSFRVDGNFISGDGVYKIHFVAKSGTEIADSGEETFTLDFSAPNAVSDYRKERKDTYTYKICWKNPDNDDFNRVIIYRSDKKEFTADSSTQVAEIGGSKNEEKCYENTIPEDKEYYYVTRVVDHAGNISGVVGDAEVTTPPVLEAAATPTPTSIVLPVRRLSPTPTEETQGGQILGEEAGEASVNQPATSNSVVEKIKNISAGKILAILTVGGGIVILAISFLKKTRK